MFQLINWVEGWTKGWCIDIGGKFSRLVVDETLCAGLISGVCFVPMEGVGGGGNMGSSRSYLNGCGRPLMANAWVIL